MKKLGDCIYQVTIDDMEDIDKDQCPETGFYFSDETEQMNGPYDSQELCKKALAHYVEAFL